MNISVEEMNKDIGKCAIYIRSIQAASIYRDNNNYKLYFKDDDGKLVYKD